MGSWRVGLHMAPSRDESERDARHRRDGGREPQNREVETNLLESREGQSRPEVDATKRRRQPSEEHGPAERETNSRGRAEHREQHALGQRLADESRSTGPERRPDRDLSPPRRRSGEQQVGDVDGTR